MKLFLLTTSLLMSFCAFPQDPPVLNEHRWQFAASYTHDYISNGYIYSKEKKFQADTLSLAQELNLGRWNSIAGWLSYKFKNNATLNLSFERFYFSGENRLRKTIRFNTATIEGSEGFSISNSFIYRGQLYYLKQINKSEWTRTYWLAGIIYDAITFRIDGEILSIVDQHDFTEDFNDQVYPYPLAGFRIEMVLGRKAADESRINSDPTKIKQPRNSIAMQTTISYVPDFLDFFHGGEHISFVYYCANANASYNLSLERFTISPALVFRLIRSKEDFGAHSFFIWALGANAAIAYRF